MEPFILHIIKYLFVAAILFLGGFTKGQSAAVAFLGAFLEMNMKIWMGSQFLAIYNQNSTEPGRTEK